MFLSILRVTSFEHCFSLGRVFCIEFHSQVGRFARYLPCGDGANREWPAKKGTFSKIRARSMGIDAITQLNLAKWQPRSPSSVAS